MVAPAPGGGLSGVASPAVPEAEDVRAQPPVVAVARALTARRAQHEPVVLPEPARTAAEAARLLGCEIGAIANSVLFDAGGRPLLVLTSGAHRVDTRRLAADLGLPPLTRAAPDFVVEHTGQRIGGVSPVGHPARVPTLVDRWLARHGVVWAAAGHAQVVFPTTFAELVRLTGGTPVDVAA